MSRTWIGAVALTLALAGVLAPTAAHAANETPATASVTATSTVTDEMATYVRSGSGFKPSSTVTVAVSVNGSPYAPSYTRTHATDANGSFSGWNWIWTYGDPYGTYTFSFSDSDGHTATASVPIMHTATAPTPATGTGLMLDTASAPALATIDIWKSDGAPYKAIGVYIRPDAAVDDRHDKVQSELKAAWVSSVQSGPTPWHVVPIHLGLQAPSSCQYSAGAFHGMATDPATAQVQGTDAADSAAAQVEALGIDPAVPVVADIEAYRSGCSTAVRAYLAGWTNELHRHSLHAGVYGSPSSVAADLTAAHAADPTYVLPDVIWAATDNRRASTSVANLSTSGWTVANQYLLGVGRTYGNTSLTIDETAVDDAAWSLPPISSGADVTAPIVTMSSARWLMPASRATFTWSGVDADSGVAAYELRTRRTAAGHRPAAWSGTSTMPAAAEGRTSQPLKPGEQVCVEVRAVDRSGNRSAWTTPACSTRLLDDRAAKAKGWKRLHQRGAYDRTVSVATRKGAVLRLGPAVAGSRLGVVRSGRGPLIVAVNGRRVGTLTGTGTRALTLPRTGTVTLTTSSAKKVTVDAYVLAP